MPVSVGHPSLVEQERCVAAAPRREDGCSSPELRLYPNSALLIASGVVGFSQRFTPAKRAGTALAS